jgi:hypothetical protein
MPQIDPIASRLQDALARGVLPPETRQRGQQLVAQLTKPPRIAVIGFPGSGKTGLVNMLLADRLMPDLPGIPVSELCHGETPRLRLELADGSSHEVAGYADQMALPPDTIRSVQHLPDSRLHDWSFLEINLSGDSADQRELLGWAAKRTDIAIWCSQRFDHRERALWSNVPDHLKDHSFLVLTKADQLFLKGELATQIAALQPVVAEEFLSLYPVATMQAIASRRSEAGGDKALWGSSGGKALFQGIRQQVEQARLADLDHASLLLDRCKIATPAPLRSAGTAATDSGRKLDIAREPLRAPPVQPALAKANTDERDAVDKALGLLHDAASELLNGSDYPNAAATDRILDRCGDIAESLVAFLSESGNRSDGLDQCREDAAEGEEMLMLLRLERGENAAADALTVLLQLKKEMSERVGT